MSLIENQIHVKCRTMRPCSLGVLHYCPPSSALFNEEVSCEGGRGTHQLMFGLGIWFSPSPAVVIRWMTVALTAGSFGCCLNALRRYVGRLRMQLVHCCKLGDELTIQ